MSAVTRVLLLSDDTHSGASLARALRAERCVVARAAVGSEGSWTETGRRYDVVVLDTRDSLEHARHTIRQLRNGGVQAPIMVLSPTNRVHDGGHTVNLPGVDHLNRPVSLTNLIARLRSLARTATVTQPSVLTAGTLSMNVSRHLVMRGSTEICLTLREFDLLEYLMRNQDAVVTKSELLHQVWNRGASCRGNSVAVCVSHLRRKIDNPFGTDTIETIPGSGYRLCTRHPAMPFEEQDSREVGRLRSTSVPDSNLP